MRKRTILGLVAAGIAIAVMYRRWSTLPVPERAREVAPIGEPVPGDQPVDREDVPTDVGEEELAASVDQGTETLPGDEEGDTGSERASKDPDRSVEEEVGTGDSAPESPAGSAGGPVDESGDESAAEAEDEGESDTTGEE